VVGFLGDGINDAPAMHAADTSLSVEEAVDVAREAADFVLLERDLSDVPALGLAGDSVDPELVDRPRRWDMGFISRFMVEFGVLSSLFDLLTFGALLGLFAAGPALFRTGWFVESLLTELAIALVVRTRRPFFRSRPGRLLLASTLGVTVLTLVLPFLPFAGTFGFTPLPGAVLGVLLAITFAYVFATELAKARFYRRAAA
jgi:P-type Mg2+ transporter